MRLLSMLLFASLLLVVPPATAAVPKLPEHCGEVIYTLPPAGLVISVDVDGCRPWAERQVGDLQNVPCELLGPHC